MNVIKTYENYMRNYLEVSREPYQSLLSQCNSKINLLINLINLKAKNKNIIIDYNDTIASVLTYCIVKSIQPFQSDNCSIYLYGKIKKTKKLFKKHNIDYKTISYKKIMQKDFPHYVISDFNPILYVFENSKKYNKIVADFYPIKDLSFKLINYLLCDFYNLKEYLSIRDGIKEIGEIYKKSSYDDFKMSELINLPLTTPLNKIILVKLNNTQNLEKTINDLNLQGHQIVFYYDKISTKTAKLTSNDNIIKIFSLLYDSMMLPQWWNCSKTIEDLIEYLKFLQFYPILFIGDWTKEEKQAILEVCGNECINS